MLTIAAWVLGIPTAFGAVLLLVAKVFVRMSKNTPKWVWLLIAIVAIAAAISVLFCPFAAKLIVFFVELGVGYFAMLRFISTK